MPCLQCKKCGNWTYVKPGEKKRCLSCGGELIPSVKCPFYDKICVDGGMEEMLPKNEKGGGDEH